MDENLLSRCHLQFPIICFDRLASTLMAAGDIKLDACLLWHHSWSLPAFLHDDANEWTQSKGWMIHSFIHWWETKTGLCFHIQPNALWSTQERTEFNPGWKEEQRKELRVSCKQLEDLLVGKQIEHVDCLHDSNRSILTLTFGLCKLNVNLRLAPQFA